MEPHIFEEISGLVESSLRFEPAERNLDWILTSLRGRAPGEAENGSLSQVEPSPLKPFDPNKVGEPLISGHGEVADSSR